MTNHSLRAVAAKSQLCEIIRVPRPNSIAICRLPSEISLLYISPHCFRDTASRQLPPPPSPLSSGPEIPRTTPEPPTSLQAPMIHPFSLMDRDSHPESIHELLALKVDRALIGKPLHSF